MVRTVAKRARAMGQIVLSLLLGTTVLIIGSPGTASAAGTATVWKWGPGVNTPQQVAGLPPVSKLAAEQGSQLALTDDGAVWAWGFNDLGQLGDGSSTLQRDTPAPVPGLSGITSIAALRNVKMAVDGSGVVWQWGGETGIVRRVPVRVTGLTGVTAVAPAWDESAADPAGAHLALHADGTVSTFGFDPAAQAWRTRPVAGLADITAIDQGFDDNGGYHRWALRRDGTLLSWGFNIHGELGNGSTVDRAAPAAVAGLPPIKMVSAGGRHVLALATDGSLWAWGQDIFGQLGDGATTDRSVPQRVTAVPDARFIEAGRLHSMAVRADGSLWAWGYDTHGELGVGSAGCRTTTCSITFKSSPARVQNIGAVSEVSSAADYTMSIAEPAALPIDPTPPAAPVPAALTLTPTPTPNGQAYDIPSFRAHLTNTTTGAPLTGVFVSWKVLSGPSAGMRNAVVTDGSGDAVIAYSRPVSSYTSADATDTVVAWYDNVTPNREPDPTEAQQTAQFAFSPPTPAISCPAAAATTPVTLPKETVPLPFNNLAQKKYAVEYGNLDLTFTNTAPAAGSYCTSVSNRGSLPVNLTWNIYSQHVADSRAVATVDFLPSSAVHVDKCDFSILKKVKGVIADHVLNPPSGTNNCMLNDLNVDNSHGVIARWTNPGFEEYLALKNLKVYSTAPLTYYVDLRTLLGPGPVGYGDALRRVEVYFHQTLIKSLPLIDTIAIVQDPPARISVTDPGGRSIGAQADGTVATFDDAGYGETGDRSTVWLTSPADGTYTATARGPAGSPYAVQFAVLPAVIPDGTPAVTTQNVSGTIGADGTSTARFAVQNGASVPAPAPTLTTVTPTRGDGQQAATGQTFAVPLTAQLADPAGASVPGAEVTFTVTSGTATFPGGATTAKAVSDGSGLATAPALLAGNTVGPVTVTASSGTGSATFTETVIGAGPERADLAMTLTAPRAAKTASTIPLTVVLSNKGPARATAVRAVLSLPAGFTVVSAGGGTVRGGLVTFTAPGLDSGRSITYSLAVKASVGGRGARLLAGAAASQTRDPLVLNNVAIKRIVLG